MFPKPLQGSLAQLDSRNPVMYIDFPEGRLKLFGTLMFPANKYLVLKFGPRDIVCEDVLESMVRLLIPSILFLAACTPMHTCFTPLHTVLHAQGLGLSALVYTAWLCLINAGGVPGGLVGGQQGGEPLRGAAAAAAEHHRCWHEGWWVTFPVRRTSEAWHDLPIQCAADNLEGCHACRGSSKRVGNSACRQWQRAPSGEALMRSAGLAWSWAQVVARTWLLQAKAHREPRKRSAEGSDDSDDASEEEDGEDASPAVVSPHFTSHVAPSSHDQGRCCCRRKLRSAEEKRGRKCLTGL